MPPSSPSFSLETCRPLERNFAAHLLPLQGGAGAQLQFRQLLLQGDNRLSYRVGVGVRPGLGVQGLLFLRLGVGALVGQRLSLRPNGAAGFLQTLDVAA